MRDFLQTTLLGTPVHRLGISTSYGLDSAGVEWALDQGLNYYWFTRSNEKAMTAPLKAAVAKDREKLFIATGPTMGFTGGSVRKACEKALKTLGTDYIDLLQVFWVGKTSRLSKGVLDTMAKLKDEGKVRGIGCSIHDRKHAGELARDRVLDVLMIRYNAGHPGAEQDIFPHVGSGADKVGIVSYTTTRWGTLLKAPGGWEDRPATAAECYRFSLSNPAVDVVLSAPGSLDELKENLKGLEEGPLDPQRIEWIRALGDKARGSNPVTGYFTEGF